MSEFTRVVDAKDLPPGKSTCIEFEGEKVALFNVAGTVYAIADTCPHAGGPLSEGDVNGTDVACPFHGAVFDLTTGSVKSPPANAGVTHYEARVEGDEIQIAAG